MTQRRSALVQGARSRIALRRPRLLTRNPNSHVQSIDNNESLPVGESRPTASLVNTWARAVSRMIAIVAERALVVLISVLALPFIGLTALAILVCNGRPVFYGQTRVGKNGVVFWIWKFRTMRTDAETSTGPVWCAKGDVRITKLGRILRATHLDELPQLFNILAGNMRIVGPRPERPEFVEQLSSEIPQYKNRLQVHPGVTGLAQIRQGYDTSIADVRRKVAWDLIYIRRAGLLFDLYILAATIPFVASEVLGHAKRLLSSSRRQEQPVMTHQVVKQQVEERAVGNAATTVGMPHVIRTDLPSRGPALENRDRSDIRKIGA